MKNGKKEEEFKRPDHNDFRTTSELKSLEFSGVRNNSITNEWEIWILGEIKGRGALKKDTTEFTKAYAIIFAMDEVKIYKDN